ncbi:Osmosensitive K+ channel histidine kinase KdpD [Serinicoccus hydrothermalis]|uniref:histidine kinase n=1 Tax=Serinicoccus hydrothermalis TaxID=1758689 RepID=A0A1B1NAE0_9MICO|nr:HAMP domain-containing sensor histidine kinase [Serinicoccus hydrothermalis]ANS78364.1 Osmosensitive K+ channel histidine kinase KdpD [Serinicoccus hydrothermalis]
MAGRSRSLRAKIVTSVVAIFACVLLLSGVATVLALRHTLIGQLDEDLRLSSERVGGQVEGGFEQPPLGGPGEDLRGPGRPPGGGDRSLTVVREGDQVVVNSVVTTDNEFGSLDEAQLTVLTEAAQEAEAAAAGAEPFSVDLGAGVGDYRVVVDQSPDGSTTLITGLPLAGVTDTTRQAVAILVPAALLSLLAAGAGSAWLVRRDLAPLDRVAATARRVSQQRLERGEVAVADRVAAADTDPGTEVGQVGQALNELLETMESALSVRHASEQRVRQFVADASHELRTPLASIRGYAELSRRESEPVPAGVRHALDRVEAESLRMQGLVEDLLLLARLDAGRPLERARVDLTLVCLDTVSDARAAGQDHTWVLDLPEEPVELVGDEARLRQVLVNLLANARTHTPPGTTVTTGLRTVGEEVEVVVADDGPGIPEQLQETVFERFARGETSRSRAAGSTGLGLSIVAAVARAHGGRVEVDSRPGRTRFVLTLPRKGSP